MLSGVSGATVWGGLRVGTPLIFTMLLLPKPMVSTDCLVKWYWTFPAGSPGKRINGLLFINRDHKILMRASWMKIRIIPRAQRNDFNLSGSTSYSFAKTLMRLKHLTPESNKNDWEAWSLVYEETLAAIKSSANNPGWSGHPGWLQAHVGSLMYVPPGENSAFGRWRTAEIRQGQRYRKWVFRAVHTQSHG